MKPTTLKHMTCTGLLCAALTLSTGCQLPTSLTGGFYRSPAVIQEETAGSETAQTEDYSEILQTLDGVSFTYAGPGGSWKTTFQIDKDGGFTGSYKSRDSKLTGKKYSKGTVYTSDFTGRFSVSGKIDDLSYTLRLDELTLSSETGEETIKKKTRYVTTNAYGLNQADEFTMYLPGYKSSALPDAFQEIIITSRQLKGRLPAEINFCGLYSSSSKSGFSSDNYYVSSGSNSYEAYLNILGYYRDDIDRYNWKYSAHTRPCALCDINGDGTKELLFFTSETEEGPGTLHIYTYIGGEAKEVSYPTPSGAGEAGSSIVFTDTNTGSGTSYVVYKDKEENALWIYRRHGDTAITYWLCRYELGSDAALQEAYALVKQGDGSTYNEYSSYGYSQETDALAQEGGSFLENGREISREDGLAAFEKGFDQIGDVLLASSPTKGISLWDKFEDSDLQGLSCEDMQAKLSD